MFVFKHHLVGADCRPPGCATTAAPAVHAGASVGDGDLDIVRTEGWFANVDGDGTRWREHLIANG